MPSADFGSTGSAAGDTDPNAAPDAGAELTALELAGRSYARQHGWTTTIDAGRLLLPLGAGIAAVFVARSTLTAVLSTLKRLDSVCPCLLLPGEDGPLVVLAEWDGLVVSPRQAPPGARLALPGERVPLPPTRLAAGVVRWVVAPHHVERFLPTLSAALMSVELAGRGPRPGAAAF
jgi:hypothetical protein